jgi:hypothetical protein
MMLQTLGALLAALTFAMYEAICMQRIRDGEALQRVADDMLDAMVDIEAPAFTHPIRAYTSPPVRSPAALAC